MSLNVRGLNNSRKRKAVFGWLKRSRHDIIFLQETHSTLELEHMWKQDWSGPIIFSHGSGNSKGCCILIRDTLDFKTPAKEFGKKVPGKWLFGCGCRF